MSESSIEFITRREHESDIGRLDRADEGLRMAIVDTERVLRGETNEKIEKLRQDTAEKIERAFGAVKEMREDLKGDIAEVKDEQHEQRTMFQKMLKGQNFWAVTIVTGVAVTVIAYFLLVHFGILHSR